MKKIYYLFTGVALAMIAASCSPLDKTYEALGPAPVATPPAGPPITVAIKLAAGDYSLLPSSNYASTSFAFNNEADAISSIPSILDLKYPTASDKSAAAVTYNLTPPAKIKPADSLLTAISYTVSNDDYAHILGGTPKYLELNDAQTIALLQYKYPDAKPNQLSFLTYIYYQSGVTPAAVTVTDTFLFLNGAWFKCYTLSAAQYVAVGRNYGDFSTTDAPSLPAIFNALLKADLAVASAAKIGDVKYVSFKYYSGSNFQRIMPLIFDGTNWVVTPLNGTLSFTKANKVWVHTVATSGTAYTLTTADYTTISKIPGVASDPAIANLVAHPSNFSLVLWNDAQINTDLIAILKTVFPAATKDQSFDITYIVYASTNVTVTKTFKFDGTNFVPVPTTAHMLDLTDFTAISKSNIATDAQRSSVAKYGDFDTSWSADDIQSVLILVLTNNFPTPQANVTYSVIYTAYNNGATSKTVNFTFTGGKWVAK